MSSTFCKVLSKLHLDKYGLYFNFLVLLSDGIRFVPWNVDSLLSKIDEIHTKLTNGAGIRLSESMWPGKMWQ